MNKKIATFCLLLALSLVNLGQVSASITGSLSVTNGNGFKRITDDQNISSGNVTIDGETIILDNYYARLRATGTGNIVIKNSQIKLDSDVNGKGREKGPFNYGNIDSTSSFLRIKENSLVLAGPFTSRHNIMISELSGGSAVIEAENTGEMFVYTQNGSILDNASFKGINTWELYGQPSVVYDVLVKDTNYGYLNWERPRLDFFGFAVKNANKADAWIGTGNGGNNSVYHWNNKKFNNQNLCLTSTKNNYLEGYTASYAFKDQTTKTPIADILLIYRDDRNNIGGNRTELARYTTNGDGHLKGTYDSQMNTTGSNIERPTLFILTAKANLAKNDISVNCTYGSLTPVPYGIDQITPELEARSYEYSIENFKLGEPFEIDGEIGKINSDKSVAFFNNVLLLKDKGITADKNTVLAYTSIDNLDEFYDRAKAEWRENDNFPLIKFAGKEIDLADYNLVIDNLASQVYSYDAASKTITIKSDALQKGTKFNKLITTGTITLANQAEVSSAILSDSIGTTGSIIIKGLADANVLVYDREDPAKNTIYYGTNQNGEITIPFNKTSSTNYGLVVRKPGFSEVDINFDPNLGGIFKFSVTQFQSLSIEGAPIYQNSGDDNQVNVDFANKKVNLGNYSFLGQKFYDILQRAENTEEGMKNPRIANFDGNEKILLINDYLLRNRDGGGSSPMVNAYVFSATGSVVDTSNGPISFPVGENQKINQIISMLEKIQGSNWDLDSENYLKPEINLVNMAGDGFDTDKHALSNQVQNMLNVGILNFNTMKDLLE